MRVGRASLPPLHLPTGIANRLRTAGVLCGEELMRRSLSIGAMAALLTCVPICVLANDTTDLGAVTVTATRTPLIADQEVAPVIVIGPEQLQQLEGQDISAALRQYAGFDIGSSGGPGQPESLFLRGTNSNHTLVMIDGVRINPDNGFGSALQNIRLDDVERIEIVKGPRASLYGSDAIGGVINIITKRAVLGTNYGAHVDAGRYGTYDSGGQFNYGEGDSSFGLSADDYHTDGFPTVADQASPSGNQDRTWTGYARTKFGGLDLALNHWQSTGYTQYISFDFNPPFDLVPFDENFQDQTTSLDLSGDVRDGWRSNLNVSHMLDEVDQRQSDPSNFPAAPDFVHTQRNVLDWQNDLTLSDAQLLTAGAYSEAESTAFLSFGSGQPENHRVNALYAEDDLDLDRQRVVLAARDTHDQAFGEHFTWNADYGYDLSPFTRLTAGAGTAFRAPTASERYGFDGNPDLEPETSRNLELGLRHRRGDDQRLDIRVFQDSLDDLIVFAPTPTSLDPFAGENQNVASARVRGLELSHTLTLKSWDWRTDVIFQDPRDLDSGQPLLRRAKRSLTSNLTWHDDRWNAGLNLLFTGPRSDVDFNTGAPVTDGGYVLMGVSLRRELGAGFAVLARIDNLLDSVYQTANGFNQAGRSIFVSLSYDSQ
jgi:vitamin B12 transporter